jgi:hypothetical protein
LPLDFKPINETRQNSLLFSLIAGNCAYRDRFDSDWVRHLNQFEFPKVFGRIVKPGLQCPLFGEKADMTVCGVHVCLCGRYQG